MKKVALASLVITVTFFIVGCANGKYAGVSNLTAEQSSQLQKFESASKKLRNWSGDGSARDPETEIKNFKKTYRAITGENPEANIRSLTGENRVANIVYQTQMYADGLISQNKYKKSFDIYIVLDIINVNNALGLSKDDGGMVVKTLVKNISGVK